MNFLFNEKEFERQLSLYQTLKPARLPSFNSKIDIFNICISGCKKIEQCSNLKKLLFKLYHNSIQ